MARGRWLRRWALPVGLTIVALVALVRAVDLEQLVATLRRADWRPLAAAALLAATVCMLAGVARLWMLLRRLPHERAIGFGELTSIQFAAAAAHNVLPSPGGDVARTVQLTAHGYSVGSLVAAQLVDKTFEAISLGIGAATMAAIGRLPLAVATSMYVVAAAGAGGVVAVAIAARSHRPQPDDAEASAAATTWRARIAVHWRRFCAAAHQLHAPTAWMRGVAWSLLGDAAGAATVGLCAMAVGIALPLPAWFAALVAARLVGVLPSTPGQVGVQEAAVVVALGLFGVDSGRALAAALLHHAAHFVPVTLLGAAALWRRRPQPSA